MDIVLTVGFLVGTLVIAAVFIWIDNKAINEEDERWKRKWDREDPE